MIRARGLRVSLAGAEILDGVSLAAEPGELVGLVGPNGAGKTTLLRTLAGYLDPDAGTVRVDGDDLHALGSKAASRRVAVVPQETSVSFDFPVRDVVAMGRHPHRSRVRPGADRDGPDRVASAIERCELTELADRSVTAVSGGERRRVLLARALAQDAPVLLLDEPTAGLDVNHQVRTLELVRSLVDDGRCAVAAVHDLPLAARYCDRLVVLSGGGVYATGPPDEVVTRGALRDAFDATAAVGTDPVTGTRAVTPLRERADAVDTRVHVLGAGDAAAGLLAPLADAGHDVTVGPVVAGGMDHEAARRLGVRAITVPPFADVGDERVREAERCVADADVVVVPEDARDVGANASLAGPNAVVVGESGGEGVVAPAGLTAAVATAVEGADAGSADAEDGRASERAPDAPGGVGRADGGRGE